MPLEKAEAAVKFEKIEITSDGTIAGTKILINGSEILLGAPYLFTKENINGFDF